MKTVALFCYSKTMLRVKSLFSMRKKTMLVSCFAFLRPGLDLVQEMFVQWQKMRQKFYSSAKKSKEFWWGKNLIKTSRFAYFSTFFPDKVYYFWYSLSSNTTIHTKLLWSLLFLFFLIVLLLVSLTCSHWVFLLLSFKLVKSVLMVP